MILSLKYSIQKYTLLILLLFSCLFLRGDKEHRSLDPELHKIMSCLFNAQLLKIISIGILLIVKPMKKFL